MRRTGALNKSRGISGRSGDRIAFRRHWTTPGLSSGQLLDAGITARQKQARRNTKIAQRPFDVYFRDQFSCSVHAPPVVGRNGILSARDAARMMTDAEATWGAPWAVRAAGLAKARHRRQDALETPEDAFGEDDLDKIIARLIELRFEWDREDDMLATSLVPESLFAVTEHSAPYSPEFEAKREGRTRCEKEAASAWASEFEDTNEYVIVDGTRIDIGKIKRNSCGHPKAKYKRPKWGFTGVDTVPSLVADVVQGPLLSSSSEPHLTLRWKAENRRPESVAEVMRLRRKVMTSSVVGLPPRTAFLLLKSAAATEMEDPALDVALLVTMGEHYGGYAMTECIELLRCVRRLGLVRGLSSMPATRGDAATEQEALFLSMRAEQQGLQQRPLGIPLYENAALTQELLGTYVRETAPFLATKVWARLPEHSQRLLSQRYYLDWIDLLSLTLESTGPSRLPDGLPNASSNAKYASKYLFFRHTLGLDETVMKSFVSHMRSSADAVAVESRGQRSRDSGIASAAAVATYVNEEKETRVKPLVLWVCAAFLVRIVAECLGDVLNHVGHSLQQHAQLAVEVDEERDTGRGVLRTGDTWADGGACAQQQTNAPDLDSYLDRLGLPRPQTVGVPPLQSRMRATKMRIRLLPYEAFPAVFQVLRTPARGATAQALQMERDRRISLRKRNARDTVAPPLTAAPSAAKVTLESPFAAVLQHSALAAKHVERAIDALAWSTMVVSHCHRLVRSLPKPAHGFGTLPTAPSLSVLSVDASENGGLGVRVGQHPACSTTARHTGWETAAAVVAQREALCERYVKSKVELLMDAVFTHVPWGEVESGIEPLFRIGEEEEAVAQSRAVEGAIETEVNEEAELLAFSLEDFSCDAKSGGQENGPAPQQEAEEELSEAEQQMRATLAALQAGIGDFQIAVADMLDAHERFFGVAEVGMGEVEREERLDDEEERHAATKSQL